jgi:hypothetical protein
MRVPPLSALAMNLMLTLEERQTPVSGGVARTMGRPTPLEGVVRLWALAEDGMGRKGDSFVLGGKGAVSVLGGNGDVSVLEGNGNVFVLGGNSYVFAMGENGDAFVMRGKGDVFVLGGNGDVFVLGKAEWPPRIRPASGNCQERGCRWIEAMHLLSAWTVGFHCLIHM